MSARIEAVRSRLTKALSPTGLEIIDESHRHVGHAGARDGRGHFHIVIVSEAFTGQAPLTRHRSVYAALGDLMRTDIHALGIDARTPTECESERRKTQRQLR